MFKVSVEKFWPDDAGHGSKRSAHAAKKGVKYSAGYHVKYEWIDSYSTKQVTSVEFYLCDNHEEGGRFVVAKEVKWPKKTRMQDKEWPYDVAERIKDDEDFIKGFDPKAMLVGLKDSAKDPFMKRMKEYADELAKLNGGLHSIAATKVI